MNPSEAAEIIAPKFHKIALSFATNILITVNQEITMPSAVESASASTIRGGHEESRPRLSEPLQYSGLLDSYTQQDLTPVIGREYKGLQVADILKAENSDQIIKDLAVTSMLCAS